MSKILYSSEHGDLRGKKNKQEEAIVNEKDICLFLRRLTSGKGRTIIEITNLPTPNKSWCKNLAKELKKSLGVGGGNKNNFIEIHGEKIDDVKQSLLKKSSI